MAISRKQLQILAFPYTKFEALICDGAIRSGKTSFMTVAFIDDAMRRFDRQRFGICGKTVDSTVKNIIAPYLAMTLPREKYALQWRRTDKLLIVRGKDGRENSFEVFGGKDESSFTLIQGRTLAGVLLDEVALQPRSFVEQAMARCSVAGSKLWFNCNPGDPNHWFYNEWVKRAEERNALHLHFDLEDNPSLDKAIIDRYHSMYSGVFYDRYIRGLWVRAEGVIYPQFADDPKRYAVNRDELPGFRHITIGVDFGGNKSAFAFVAAGITDDWSVYALRSLRIPASGVSVEQMTHRFVLFAESVERDYGRIDDVYADSAEQAIIESLRQQIAYPIRNSVKGEIINRIRATDILLTSERFRYVKDECDTLVLAMSCCVWDEKQQDDVRLDDGSTDIDTMDAFEYSWSGFIRYIIRG